MKLRDVLDNAAEFSLLGTVIVCRKDWEEQGQYIRVFREVTSNGGFKVQYEYCPDQKTFPGAGAVRLLGIPEGSESKVLHSLGHYVDFDSEDWEIAPEAIDLVNSKIEDWILRTMRH